MQHSHSPDLSTVCDLALKFFAQNDIGVVVDGTALVSSDGRTFGLEALRCRLAAAPPAEWEQVVANHFSVLINVSPVMPASIEEARPHLRSAVIAESDMGLSDGALLERKLVDGWGSGSCSAEVRRV